MMKYSAYGISISICLENGLYFFRRISSTGKTRLFKYLKTLSGDDDYIYACTYDKYGLDSNKIFASKRKLVIFDRYDLYCDILSRDELLKLGNEAVVLFDFKTYTPGYKVKMKLCELDMEANALNVYVRDIKIGSVTINK